MAKMERKDYGADAIVSPSNPTVKRVNTQNSPYSTQATGHDLPNSKLIPLNSENLDALVTGTRVLDGQLEKTVKTVNKTSNVLDDAVISYIDAYTGEEVTKTYTKNELLASSTIFLAKV